MIVTERHVEDVIKADTGRHSFEAQRVGVIGWAVRTVVHRETRMMAMMRGTTIALRTWYTKDISREAKPSIADYHCDGEGGDDFRECIKKLSHASSL